MPDNLNISFKFFLLIIFCTTTELLETFFKFNLFHDKQNNLLLSSAQILDPKKDQFFKSLKRVQIN